MKHEGNVKNPTTGKTAGLRFPGDSQNSAADDESSDRLQSLSKWLGSSDNRRFAATQANRIWFQLLGRGIVDPIDDFRSTNPASNPELLDALTQKFVSRSYRVRELMRLILNSRTYQLSSEPNPTNTNDVTSFSRTIPQRLTAEQTLDAISQVLDVSAKFDGYPDASLTQQDAGVADDSAFVTADVCTRGVAGALSASQLIEASQGFHHDHGWQDSAHADVVQSDGVQQRGRVKRFPAAARRRSEQPPIQLRTACVWGR